MYGEYRDADPNILDLLRYAGSRFAFRNQPASVARDMSWENVIRKATEGGVIPDFMKRTKIPISKLGPGVMGKIRNGAPVDQAVAFDFAHQLGNSGVKPSTDFLPEMKNLSGWAAANPARFTVGAGLAGLGAAGMTAGAGIYAYPHIKAGWEASKDPEPAPASTLVPCD
jgi:hypothetical protein